MNNFMHTFMNSKLLCLNKNAFPQARCLSAVKNQNLRDDVLFRLKILPLGLVVKWVVGGSEDLRTVCR